MKKKWISLLLLSLFAFSLITNDALSFQAKSSHEVLPFNFKEVISNIDMELIQKYIRDLSGEAVTVGAHPPTRVTGSIGCDMAAEYIRSVYLDNGLLNVSYDYSEVTVPVSLGGNLTIQGKKITIYPLMPNSVCPSTTPSGGITGHLIYVGTGTLRELNYKKVNGSIVLMDFNSQLNWLNVANLGAKAVIFIEPVDTTRNEAEMKRIRIPFNFPRFYISAQNTHYLLKLLEENATAPIVRVEARMEWRNVKAKNVYGYIKGTKQPDKYVWVIAHYDSYSIVPDVAPGADDASGIAVLLALTKYFHDNPPLYSIIFIAFSGNHQGLAGSRDYVYRHFFPEWYLNPILNSTLAIVNLDLSSESDTIVPTIYGGFKGGTLYLPDEEWMPLLKDLLANSLVTTLKQQLNIEYHVLKTGTSQGRTAGVFRSIFGNNLPEGLGYGDHEPFVSIWMPAMSITTVNRIRKYEFTPLDILENMNMENLKIQVEYVFAALHTLANMPDLENIRPHPYLAKQLGGGWVLPEDPRERYSPSRAQFNWLNGSVAYFDKSTAWYTPIPRAIFYAYFPASGPEMAALTLASASGEVTEAYAEGWGEIYVMTDENGTFFIPGVRHWAPFEIGAFVIDPETGNVLYAPDQGIRQYQPPSTKVLPPYPQLGIDVGFFSVFKCGSIVIFDIMDPKFGQVPAVAGWPSVKLSLYESRSHAPPESFGFLYYVQLQNYAHIVGRPISIAFVPPGTKSEIAFQTIYALRYSLTMLTNASRRQAIGSGYTLKAGEQLILQNTILQSAENLYWLNHERLITLLDKGIGEDIWKRHLQNGELIKQAHQALRSMLYDKARLLSIKAWSLEHDIYVECRSTIEDAVNTLPFFSTMLIPFAFLGEKLLFSKIGRKRIIGSVVLFAALTAIITMHPGFTLASNGIMVIVGFVILILSIPLLAILLGNFYDFLLRTRIKVMGEHFSSVSKSAAASMAFSVEILHMRRSRLSTALTLITIILIVIGLVSFASLRFMSVVSAFMIEGEAPYSGIFIRRDKWGRAIVGLGDEIPILLETAYSKDAYISPRAWAYPMWAFIGDDTFYRLTYKDKELKLRGVVGLSPQEANVTDIDKVLIKGRWFLPVDWEVCILTKNQAEMLGITDIGETVNLGAAHLVVVGILDDALLEKIIDLDQQKLTPLELKLPPPNPYNVHHPYSADLILPYRYAKSLLNAFTASVALRFKEPQKVTNATMEIFSWLKGLNIYSTEKTGKVNLYTQASVTTVFGIQSQIVPFVMVCMALLNIMISNIKRRDREIQTLSSVGLSPYHLALMFLTQATIFAILGSIIGYALAIIFIRIGAAYFPGLTFLNYSSKWVVTSITFAMLAVVISAIYPMIKASKAVTPSLERAWKMPTRPKGNLWEIPLPFILRGEEVNGAIVFIQESMLPHRIERAELFELRDLQYDEGEREGNPYKTLIATVRLPPYEQAIRQTVRINLMKVEAVWRVTITIIRKSGSRTQWETSNRHFIDFIRKQFLMWRALAPEKKQEYIQRFRI